MPAPAVVAAKAALTVLRSRRGRRLVLGFLAGLILSLALVIIVLLSSVGAVVGVCRQEAAAQPASAPSGSSDSPGISSGSPGTPAVVSQEWSEEALSDVPQDYLPIYEKAAGEKNIDMAILAAIGKKETDHGRLDAPGVQSGENFAGAGGPMQFLADTWASVGVDGNGDGTKDRYDPEDAIHGAANYLSLEGAPEDYQSAIFAYNRAQWYVDDILAIAEGYRASGSGGGSEGGDGGEMAGNETGSPGLASLLSPLAMREAQAADGAGTVGNPGATNYSSMEIDTLKLINDYRQENGLQALELSDKISTASAHYAHDMAKYDAYRNPEAHVSGPTDYYFEGAVLTDRMNEEGYTASKYGENIAAGQAGPQEVFEGWRNSPGHNEMMLNPEMNVIGIGLVENPSTSYEEFWVTNFGSEPDDTTRPVSEAGGSGGGSGNGSGGSGGEVQGNSKAVFPLPEEYFDDYEDTWGAARGGGRGHEGTDMFAPDGTPIYSITKGKVVPVAGSDDQGWNELGGWTVMVEAAEDVGPVKAGDRLYYAHLLESPSVKPGDTVEAGDVIGKVGSTGEGPVGSILPEGRGEHLHLGWYDDTGNRAAAASGAMDPYPLLEWLRENGGTATGTGGGSALGAPASSVPAYCRPLQALGLVPTAPGGGGEAVPTSSGPDGGGSGGDSGAEPGSGSATGKQVVEEALKYQGVSYVLGGPEDCIPGEAMDCTCLTTTVYKEFGFDLPDAPESVLEYGEEVTGEPQAGDIHIWGDPGDGTGGHVAIEMGDGRLVHANMGTMDTSVTPFWDSPDYIGARRLVN